MMETTLYTYQFLYAKQLKEEGKFGKIQFLRGSHYQDMVNWPSYWLGLPPMWYGTHAIAPMVALSDSRIKRVNCFGSGTMEEELTKQYGNPFPMESALFEFENGLKGEATRSLFETARMYRKVCLFMICAVPMMTPVCQLLLRSMWLSITPVLLSLQSPLTLAKKVGSCSPKKRD